MSSYGDFDTSALGPNMWLIDEMYRQYRENPGSIDEKWREFFEDFRPRIGDGTGSEGGAPAPQASPHSTPAPRTPPPSRSAPSVAERTPTEAPAQAGPVPVSG